MGGTGEIRFTPMDRAILKARLGRYTIEHENDHDCFTALKDGTEYDIGSDYNPGGYEFYYRIKNLEYLI